MDKVLLFVVQSEVNAFRRPASGFLLSLKTGINVSVLEIENGRSMNVLRTGLNRINTLASIISKRPPGVNYRTSIKECF